MGLDNIHQDVEMQDRIADYDLSFLKIHELVTIALGAYLFTLDSQVPYDFTTYTNPDRASITIESEFILNGAKIDRGALLALIGQSFEDARIDLNYELHLRFASGQELVTIRNESGFESYQIEWSLDPKKYVVII